MKNITNKKLSIVFLDFDDIKNPLLAAGQAKATLEVGKRLVKKGHQVLVICSKYPGYKDRTENGIEYKHIGIGTGNIKFNNAIYILSVWSTVRKITTTNVIIECFTAPISTMFSPLFTKIPVIALPSMFNAAEFTRKYHLPFHLIERLGMKFYKYIMPYSEVDAAKAVLLNPNIKYKIVPQGVGKEFFRIKHKKPEHILFLGRFDNNQKGIDLLLEAYSKISDTIDYPLVIAGRGPDEKKIIDLIGKLNLKSKVSVVGSAYGKKKFDLISKAVFVAFPSRHDELSLWALEALASGMPLVAFNLPEAKWADETVALKAKPFDTTEYSNLLLKATNKELNSKMRKATRHLASKYTWEKVASQFEEFMNTIIEKETKII